MARVALLREPDFHALSLLTPLKSLLVGSEVEVDVVTLDGAASILDTAVTIAFDVHNRAKWKLASIGGNRALTCFRATGGDAYLLNFPLQRTTGEHRPQQPVAFPATAFPALAVTCREKRCRLRSHATRRPKAGATGDECHPNQKDCQ